MFQVDHKRVQDPFNTAGRTAGCRGKICGSYILTFTGFVLEVFHFKGSSDFKGSTVRHKKRVEKPRLYELMKTKRWVMSTCE